MSFSQMSHHSCCFFPFANCATFMCSALERSDSRLTSSSTMLYTPFHNRECLYCHAGMRAFEEEPKHSKTPAMMSRINSTQMSCTSAHCHDTIHDVATLPSATFWKGGH